VSKVERPVILIVDDAPDVLDAIDTFLLVHVPLAQVLLARSGPEALKILRSTPVDVLLTDQRMPKMTGLQLIKEAKEIRPAMRLALMTAYHDADVEQGARDLGVDHVIHKPFDTSELIDTIRTLQPSTEDETADRPDAARRPPGALGLSFPSVDETEGFGPDSWVPGYRFLR
jgi:YesN/AraC family two-component response regulator